MMAFTEASDLQEIRVRGLQKLLAYDHALELSRNVASCQWITKVPDYFILRLLIGPLLGSGVEAVRG